MQAYEFYQNMGDRFYELSKQDKRFLGATKKCYVFAAENAYAISNLWPDPENQTKK